MIVKLSVKLEWHGSARNFAFLHSQMYRCVHAVAAGGRLLRVKGLADVRPGMAQQHHASLVLEPAFGVSAELTASSQTMFGLALYLQDWTRRKGAGLRFAESSACYLKAAPVGRV